MIQEKEYYAFISYKREDEKWAKWLQNKLEHYRFPTNLNGRTDLPKQIYPTFRDVTDLTPGLLSEEIDQALHNSQWLIVICSPRSAKSPWVCKEAQTFINLGRADHIIPFVIEGFPFSNDPATECYPEALLQLTGSKELLGTNINEMGRDAAAIKVVARMFGIRFDILWQRYEREQKKRRRNILIGVLALAVTAICVAGWLWSLNSQLANKNRQLSIENVKVSCREVIGLLEQGNYVKARHELQALTALWQEDYREWAPEFEQTLRAMYRYELTDGIIKLFSIPLSYEQRYLGSDSSYLYICTRKDWKDEVLRYDISTGEYKDKVFPTPLQRDSAMVMEIKGNRLLYCTTHNYYQDSSLRLYDLTSDKDILLMEHCSSAKMLSDECVLAFPYYQYANQEEPAELITIKGGQIVSRDAMKLPFYPEKTDMTGDTLTIATGSKVATYITKQQRWINQMTYRSEDENDYIPQNVLAVNSAAQWMANLRQGYGLLLFNTSSRDSIVINPKMMEASVAFNPSGTLMAVTDTYSDSLVVYLTESMIPLLRLSSPHLEASEVEFVDDATIVTYRSGSALDFYSVAAHFNTYLNISPDGNYLLSKPNQEDKLEIINDSTRECVLSITDINNNNLRILGFSPHGRYLKIGTPDYSYGLFDFHEMKTCQIIPYMDYWSPWRLYSDCFSDDETSIAFLWKGYHYEKSDTLKVFDINRGAMKEYVPGKQILNIALSHDGSQLAYSDGNSIQLLQIDSVSIRPRQNPSTVPDFSVMNLSVLDFDFTPDDKHLVVSYSDGTLRRLDIETGQTDAPIMHSDDGVTTGRINISHDGQYVIGTTDCRNDKWEYDIWHIPTGHLVDRLTNEWSWFMKPYLPEHINLNFEACFSSDGSPRIIVNERQFMGLSRTFSFPSFEDLVEMYRQE